MQGRTVKEYGETRVLNTLLKTTLRSSCAVHLNSTCQSLPSEPVIQ